MNWRTKEEVSLTRREIRTLLILLGSTLNGLYTGHPFRRTYDSIERKLGAKEREYMNDNFGERPRRKR